MQAPPIAEPPPTASPQRSSSPSSAMTAMRPYTCAVCGVATGTLCSGCQGPAYCSTPCQSKAWVEGHERECAASAASKFAAARVSAATGNAAAQYAVGQLYSQGVGVERSAQEAAVWFRRAASGGHTDAQCQLGVAYTQGLGACGRRVWVGWGAQERAVWKEVDVVCGRAQKERCVASKEGAICSILRLLASGTVRRRTARAHSCVLQLVYVPVSRYALRPTPRVCARQRLCVVHFAHRPPSACRCTAGPRRGCAALAPRC